MDAVAILKEETCWKLSEIETYLLDFKDIIENIETSERADAVAAMVQQQEARRNAKLRQVRESHAAYERERAERLERGEDPGHHGPKHRKGGAHQSALDASYSHSSSSRDYSQNSSMVYKSSTS
jgi:hypothetical protein